MDQAKKAKPYHLDFSGSRKAQWTEELHAGYLTWLEQSFVQKMLCSHSDGDDGTAGMRMITGEEKARKRRRSAGCDELDDQVVPQLVPDNNYQRGKEFKFTSSSTITTRNWRVAQSHTS